MKIERDDFKKLQDLILLQPLKKADIIIWLQSDRYDHAVTIWNLYKNGWSNKIIISGNNILIGPDTKQGENNVSLAEMKNWLLKKGMKKNDLIIDDGAMNTKDQAEHIMSLAVKENWQKIILVASSYYHPRAFLTFLKQAQLKKWDGEIINRSVIMAQNRRPGGRDKKVKLMLIEELGKIKRYKKDLALISQGIKYLNRLK
jgi:hypothetical protein